jgi:hypothetical protein
MKNMKPQSKHFSFRSGYCTKFLYVLMPLVFLFFCANAQVKSPPRNMDEYRKTPQYAARKAKLDKNTPGGQSKSVAFKDGTKLIVTLDRKASTSHVAGPVTKKVGKEKKESSGGYDCTTTTVNLSATSDNFLNNDYSGTTANIYPGACYTYANLTNGSWKEQTGARNSLMVTTDNPNIHGDTYVNVQNPNVGTLGTAVAKLFSRFTKTNGQESLTYQVSEASNSAVYNLQIGAAASGYGVDLSNVYSTGNQSNHVHLTIDATKILFTMGTTPPDSGFFKDPKIEETPYLSYISEISYGVRVLANADITFASEAEADQFKGSYSGYGVSVSLDVNYGSSSKNTSATINGYMIGGPGTQVVAYSLDDLKKQIEKAFAGATYQNARPISYKVCSMAGDALNTYSATDNFNERSCVPAPAGAAEIDDVTITFTQGDSGKSPDAHYTVALFPGRNTNRNLNDAMFFYQDGVPPNPANQPYANNSTVTVILRPNKPKFDKTGKIISGYKGKFDLESLQNGSGGTVFISPLAYQPGKYPGQWDWKIDGVSVTINLKPTSANPNPKPIGGNSLSWALEGSNEVNLWTGTQNQSFLFFDRNFAPAGNQ